ncbi:hypothetical protein R9X47_10855 [Wukongibacter baidiensis]|uniref:hypothetical protein n=1 Tax=Wukongibacter baidiensis TaxID=1723361 RepID=UPI003D7F2FAB
MKTIAKNIGKSKRIAHLDHRFLGKILNKYYMRYNNYLGYFSFTHRQNPALEYFENLSNQIDCHLELLNDQQTNILTTNNIVKSVLRNVQNTNDLRKKTVIHNNLEISNIQNHYKQFNNKQVSKNANIIHQNKNLIKNFTEEIHHIKNILNLEVKNLDYSQFLEKNLLIEKIKEEISKSNEEHNVKIHFSDNDYIKLTENFILEAIKTQEFNNIFKKRILGKELVSSDEIKDKGVVNNIIVNSLKETMTRESFNREILDRIQYVTKESKETPQNRDLILSIFKKVFINNRESLLKANYSYKNHISNLKKESKNIKHIKSFTEEISNINNILNLDVKKIDYNKFFEQNLLIEKIKEEVLNSNKKYASNIHFSDDDYIKLTETFISESIKTPDFNNIFKKQILKSELASKNDLKDKAVINNIIINSLKETMGLESFNRNISYKIESLTNEFNKAPENIEMIISVFKKVFINNSESMLKANYNYKNHINNLKIENKSRKLIKSFKEEINSVNNILDLGRKKLDYSKLIEKNLLIERIKEEILKSNEEHIANIHVSDNDYIKLTETFISEAIKTPEFDSIFKTQILKSKFLSRNNLNNRDLINNIIVNSLKDTIGMESYNRNISYKLQSITSEFKETPENIDIIFATFKKLFINNTESLFKTNYRSESHISSLEIERKNRKLIKSFKEEINNVDNILNLDVESLKHNEFIDKNILVEKIKEEILNINEEYVYNTNFSNNDYVKLADTFISEAVKTQDFNNILKKRIIRNRLSDSNDLYKINNDIINSIKETIVLEAFNRNISYRIDSLTKEFNEGSNNISIILSAFKKVLMSNTEGLLKIAYNNRNNINNLEFISSTKQLFKTNNRSYLNRDFNNQLYFPYIRNVLRKVSKNNNIENQVKNTEIFKTLLNRYKHNYLMNSYVSKININKDSRYREILNELLLDKTFESNPYSNSFVLQELKSLESKIDVNLNQITKRISNFDKVVNKSDNNSSNTSKIIYIDSIKDLKAKKLINNLTKIENLSYEDNDYRTYNENKFSELEINNLSKSAKTKLLFLNKFFTGREAVKSTNLVPIANRNVYKQIDYLYKNITRNKITSLKNEHNLISFYDNRFIQRRNYNNHLGDTLNELLSVNNLRFNNTKNSKDYDYRTFSKTANIYQSKTPRRTEHLDMYNLSFPKSLLHKEEILKNLLKIDFLSKNQGKISNKVKNQFVLESIFKKNIGVTNRESILNTYVNKELNTLMEETQVKELLNRKVQKHYIDNDTLISSKDNIEIYETIHKNIDFINRNLDKYINTSTQDYRSNLLNNKYISYQIHRSIGKRFTKTDLRKFENHIIKGDGTKAYLELFDLRSFPKNTKYINKNILKIEKHSAKEIVNKLNILKVHNKRNESISSFSNFSYKRNTSVEKGLGYKGSDINEEIFSQYEKHRFGSVDMAYKRNYNFESDLIQKISQDQTKLKKVVEEEIQKVKKQNRQEVNIVSITDRVYKNIERKLKSERQRRGMI